ncbi:RepB family DNA primase [Undibacterium sp. RTI2.1]|uniref:RepB family DNA primase n=1 Tax=unclassified Undibacterium TaxID=2630295 RepID=UPI002B2297E5|nr:MULTISPECIES: RepB family DNA primase [unclassified Undibacterium]MEB0032149.1 RepB family DNA primase [Undibacterium sp. RTI2.1]MEB0118321.1 RepB family DNA primase [Undibacterium sp. RTI2.2]
MENSLRCLTTKGFTPDDMAQRTPEMQRLQKRGENIYYTPLSESKHHILIDDMNRAKLDKFIADGYKPAVILESSPGNYQAIVTVPKLGTAHDRDVGNRLSDRLNKEYGDPKLSGCIHPHRAPSYQNRKLKHRRDDGTFPEVKLLKAEKRECDKTLHVSREIDAEYQKLAQQKTQQKEREPKAEIKIDAPAGGVAQAYQKHYEDVIARQRGGAIDLSRVDSMIAVRLRVTGYQQGEIANVVKQCAPATRPKEEARDWNDYAQRTARYAYSAAGDRQATELGKYRQQWEKLEGREPVKLLQKKQEIVQEVQEKAQKIERDNAPSMSR